ncbi:MAG: Unknown protein, partial [uncultured Sulfurovum sp.]
LLTMTDIHTTIMMVITMVTMILLDTFLTIFSSLITVTTAIMTDITDVVFSDMVTVIIDNTDTMPLTIGTVSTLIVAQML